ATRWAPTPPLPTSTSGCSNGPGRPLGTPGERRRAPRAPTRWTGPDDRSGGPGRHAAAAVPGHTDEVDHVARLSPPLPVHLSRPPTASEGAAVGPQHRRGGRP